MTLNLVFNSQDNQFNKSDLDLDPMTLALKPEIDIVKLSHHTKNEVSMSRHPKSYSPNRQTHTHADRQYENITFPPMWVVRISLKLKVWDHIFW